MRGSVELPVVSRTYTCMVLREHPGWPCIVSECVGKKVEGMILASRNVLDRPAQLPCHTNPASIIIVQFVCRARRDKAYRKIRRYGFINFDKGSDESVIVVQ